jgi:hypothetical protein
MRPNSVTKIAQFATILPRKIILYKKFRNVGYTFSIIFHFSRTYMLTNPGFTQVFQAYVKPAGFWEEPAGFSRDRYIFVLNKIADSRRPTKRGIIMFTSKREYFIQFQFFSRGTKTNRALFVE